MTKKQTRPSPDEVILAVREGPTFTLVAHDRLAPATIRDWALRAARLGSPSSKIGQAVLISVEMEKWQVRHGSKVPD